jgi:hypothetical protein
VGLARCGRQQEALEILGRLKIGADAGRRELTIRVAEIYTALDDHPKALDYLERASKGYEYHVRLRDPLWDPLRGEPRFIALRKRMGLD